MRVLIAGVSGSLGRHLAGQLRFEGHEVVGISRTDPKIDGVKHVSHDLREPLDLKYFSDWVLINSAAVTQDGFSRKILDSNLAIAKNCLALTNGPQILVSSSSVYDLRKPSLGVREDEASGDYPFLNSYSESKFVSETLYRESGKPGIILRPHALVGAQDSTLLPRLRRSIRNGRLYLPSAGRALHEFTSYENFGQAVSLSLKKLDSGLDEMVTMNVSDGVATELASAIMKSISPEHVDIRNIPTALAMFIARIQELSTPEEVEPMISRYAISQLAFDRSYDLERITRLLGYIPMAPSF